MKKLLWAVFLIVPLYGAQNDLVDFYKSLNYYKSLNQGENDGKFKLNSSGLPSEFVRMSLLPIDALQYKKDPSAQNQIECCVQRENPQKSIFLSKDTVDELVEPSLIVQQKCNITPLVKSLGTENIAVVVHGEAISRIKVISSEHFAINFLKACSSNDFSKDMLVRGFLGYLDSANAHGVVKEAVKILPQQGLMNLKGAFSSPKGLHFRGVIIDTKPFLDTIIDEINQRATKNSWLVALRSHWKKIALGGGIFAGAIIYLFFIRNK